MNRTFTGFALLLWMMAGGCSPKSADSGDSAATTSTTSSTTSSSPGTTSSSPTSSTSTTGTSSSSSTSSTSTSTRPTGPDGGPPDRTPCETDEDCVDACHPDSLGCVCYESPREELICVPSCVTDDDCPKTPKGQMNCDEEEGICMRDRTGGGGPGT